MIYGVSATASYPHPHQPAGNLFSRQSNILKVLTPSWMCVTVAVQCSVWVSITITNSVTVSDSHTDPHWTLYKLSFFIVIVILTHTEHCTNYRFSQWSSYWPTLNIVQIIIFHKSEIYNNLFIFNLNSHITCIYDASVCTCVNVCSYKAKLN